jgi:hypothetical protein
MLTNDPYSLYATHQQDLLDEANRERLVASLPPRPSVVRKVLAGACIRVATWLDAPAGYVQLPDPGPEDWATPWASV